MLDELRIQNFAIIDQLELELDGGLNIITGETGAGKSIIVDAVELLLGGKPDTALIRSGKQKAVVEGVFVLRGKVKQAILEVLRREELIEGHDSDHVILAREMRSNGRSMARINGITVKQDLLREVGDLLVDIHGQSEHLSLFNPPHHLDLLDRYADLMEIREALRTVVGNLQKTRREIKSLQQDKEELQRRADRLRREVEEIEVAVLEPGEDDEIKAELKRLSNSERLAQLSGEVAMILSGENATDDYVAAVDQLMQVSNIMKKLQAIDPELDELAEMADGLADQAQELAIQISGYGDEVEYDPVRINELEERLELINGLRRRYGVSIELVIEYGEKARAELESIDHSEERLEDLRKTEEQMLRQIGDLSASISKVRKDIGKQLSKRVVEELKDLRMDRTRFEVQVEHTPDPDGCYVGKHRYKFDITGIDNVEFMMSANPGEPMRPLAKVASGGEAARIMLALKRVLTQADHTPTLIFDEVDQGIGGRVGSVVGEKLWSLTDGHQVMVVTHLPQLAGYADRHYNVRKAMGDERTTSEIISLDDDAARIAELSDMLGGTGEGSKQSALEILTEARARKGIGQGKLL
jgi:DNA repair protein RecN (Recombination protein N)